MRPRSALVFLALLVPGLAGAQIHVGPVAAFNASTFSGDGPDEASYGRRSGVSAGLTGEAHVTDDVVLCLQPAFAQRGTDIAFEVDGESRDSLRVRLDYLDVTALVKILPDRGPAFFTSGVTVGFLTGATMEGVDRVPAETDVESLMNGVDVSVLFGVGARIPLHPGELNLELRYSQSLGNIADTEADPFAAGLPPRIRSSGLQLGVTWLFRVGG